MALALGDLGQGDTNLVYERQMRRGWGDVLGLVGLHLKDMLASQLLTISRN